MPNLIIFRCSAKLVDMQFWNMHTFASRPILFLFGRHILSSEGVSVVKKNYNTWKGSTMMDLIWLKYLDIT